MPSIRLDGLLILALFAVFTVSACPFGHAQALAKPDAPAVPQRPIVEDHRASAIPYRYEKISGTQRIRWAAVETFGPESLLRGTLSAAIGTGRDAPEEYGPHWAGFAKRYGMRFTGVAASNTIEAGLGAIWGEDPRYMRRDSMPFKTRLGNVFLRSIAARNRAGKLKPAYARYIAIPGSNFLANTWRVNSEANTSAALTRTAYGFLGEISSNAWQEFWPDVKRIVFKK